MYFSLSDVYILCTEVIWNFYISNFRMTKLNCKMYIKMTTPASACKSVRFVYFLYYRSVDPLCLSSFDLWALMTSRVTSFAWFRILYVLTVLGKRLPTCALFCNVISDYCSLIRNFFYSMQVARLKAWWRPPQCAGFKSTIFPRAISTYSLGWNRVTSVGLGIIHQKPN